MSASETDSELSLPTEEEQGNTQGRKHGAVHDGFTCGEAHLCKLQCVGTEDGTLPQVGRLHK